MSDEQKYGHTNGFEIEEWAVRRFSEMEHAEASEWHDLVYDGRTPIEVKSCEKRIGRRNRNGRFRIWERQHERLKDQNGQYLFVVWSETINRPDKTGFLTPVDLEARTDGLNFYGAGNHHKRDNQTKITWTKLQQDNGR